MQFSAFHVVEIVAIGDGNDAQHRSIGKIVNILEDRASKALRLLAALPAPHDQHSRKPGHETSGLSRDRTRLSVQQNDVRAEEASEEREAMWRTSLACCPPGEPCVHRTEQREPRPQRHACSVARLSPGGAQP
jgi:hypothetical protein